MLLLVMAQSGVVPDSRSRPRFLYMRSRESWEGPAGPSSKPRYSASNVFQFMRTRRVVGATGVVVGFTVFTTNVPSRRTSYGI